MRINKYIASAGFASRRKADRLIADGNVKINGEILREPGYEVMPGDVVHVNNRVIKPKTRHTYVLLNKPMGYITTMQDEKGRATVMELVQAVDARIFPVGRLDYNTEGLLILTDDGDLAYRLMHPKHKVTKTYRALVAGDLSRERQAQLRKGVDIGGFVTSPAKVEIVKVKGRSTIVDITIHEGKNRQVRKMFSAVGNPVQGLVRTAIGELKLGRLAIGHYRKLTKDEIEYLKNM